MEQLTCSAIRIRYSSWRLFLHRSAIATDHEPPLDIFVLAFKMDVTERRGRTKEEKEMGVVSMLEAGAKTSALARSVSSLALRRSENFVIERPRRFGDAKSSCGNSDPFARRLFHFLSPYMTRSHI